MFAKLMATGAVVVGRKTFDYAGHWGGDHHGVPIFVPTRGTPPEPQSGWVHYATAMREAKAAAGDQDVMVHGDPPDPVVLGDWRRLFGADRIELEKAGAPVAVRGFGMLFDDRQPDGNKIEER